MKPMDRALILTPAGQSGELSHSPAEDYLFRYGIGAAPDRQISLTMPIRDSGYTSRALHPIFQMNLPEGYVLEQLRNRLAKSTPINPMLLMALAGSGSPIGRIRVEAPLLDEWLQRAPQPSGERLDELLAWDGAQDLFASLLDKYILRSGISGVQPKLIVPEQVSPDSKVTVLTPELIVKTGRDDFPGLAINEFVCMDAARRAGIAVPEFFLSDNHRLFVMRRFDRAADQRPLGFEDMAVLTGLGTEDKYNSSYEKIARVLRLFCAPGLLKGSLEQLFDMVALSCMVGNGDGHLKNFGLLYEDSLGADARLAPAYDIVNTTAYLPEDSLALSLAGSKSLFRSRLGILDFAESCEIHDANARLRRLIEAVEESLAVNRHLAPSAPRVFEAIASAQGHFAQTFR